MNKDALQVDTTEGQRFQLALELLTTGHAIVYRDVALWLSRDGRLEVTVNSTWWAENVSEQTAREDLEAARSVVEELQQASRAFDDLTRDRSLRFNLVHDYGMGALLLCRLENGVLHWQEGFPKRT